MHTRTRTHTRLPPRPGKHTGTQPARGWDGARSPCRSRAAAMLWLLGAGRVGRWGYQGARGGAEQPLSSPITSSAASCLPFGVKHMTFEAVKPTGCGRAWLQAVAVPWEMLGLTGDNPGLSEALGHGSLLGSRKGFFLLRKRSCRLGTGSSVLAASLYGQGVATGRKHLPLLARSCSICLRARWGPVWTKPGVPSSLPPLCQLP